MMEHPEKEEWQEKSSFETYSHFEKTKKKGLGMIPPFHTLFPPFFKIPMLSYLERYLGDLREFFFESGILFAQVAH